ncbi:hypothetical protein V6N11_018946 [Hibiscus sabdariffa]|uniref:MBD domain-containing protein n=1 Tax=Hibiscus sabdariffa TaxID=183260 RepID=A0ABR2R1G5_9ROSI
MRTGTRAFKNNNSPRQIPDRWKLVKKPQKDGSSLLYYTCPESGQKYYSYEDLMRYVNYAKAAKLSIYADDFCPLKPARQPKKRASTPESNEKSLDLDESTMELSRNDSFEWVREMIMEESVAQFGLEKMKLENNPASNEGCSSSMGNGKKQKM